MSGPSFASSLRLALLGERADRVRMGLTALAAIGTTFFLLAAASVAAIGLTGDAGRYQTALLREEGLRPGVIAGLIAVTVPLLVLIGQCSRLATPARNRRLAGLRMAGATASEVRRLVELETAMSAGGGALAATLLYALGRTLIPNTSPSGQLRMPLDQELSPFVYLLVVIAVVVFAGFAAKTSTRATILEPLGITHQRDDRIPSPATLATLSVGLLVVIAALATVDVSRFGDGITLGALAVLLIVASSSFAVTTAAISLVAGRWLVRTAGQPSVVLAASRLETTPFRSSRTLATVMVAAMIAGGAQVLRVGFPSGSSVDSFYANSFRLVNAALMVAIAIGLVGLLVAASEGIAERRRTLAALVALGTPRSTLARSVLVETLVPLIPGVLIAVTTGALVVRSFARSFGDDYALPWLRLAIVYGGTITAALAITSLSLLLLPASTSVTELRAAA